MSRTFACLACVSFLLVACDGDDVPRLPPGHEYLAGPVVPVDDGRPCGIFPSDETALLEWSQPPTRSEGEEPGSGTTTSRYPGIQVHVADRIDGLDEVPIEILDPSTCEIVARHSATFKEDSRGRKAYVAPLEVLRAELDQGLYVARIAATIPGVGGIGSTVQYRPTFYLQHPVCEGQLAIDTEIDFGSTGGERTFPIAMNTAADLCIEVTRLSDFWVVREIVINSQRVHPPSAETTDLNRYVVEYPGRAHDYAVKVSLAKGKARVVARVKGKPVPAAQSEIDCGGGLQGYDDPFVETQRRAIKRPGVRIGCTAVYRTSRKFEVKTIVGTLRRENVIARATAPSITNNSGRFAATISPETIYRAGAGESDELLGIESDCLLASQCGVDRVGARTTIPEWAVWLPIVNVPDIAFSGLVARLISADRVREPLGFKSDKVATAGFGGFPALGYSPANDLPVVFHEPFDPLLEDGTVGVAWALGGQPTDYSKPFDPDRIRANACAGTIVGACYPKKNQLFPLPPPDPNCRWSESCPSSSETSTERFRCEGTNLLKIMLDNGYDVWIVDHVREDPTVLELATRAPVLYQQIADFPAREWFGRTNRKLTVVGISMGAVVTRTGIRLWELRDKLDRLSAASELQLVRPDLLRDDASERIALHISYEGPHRGTLVPVTFQALVKDNTMPSRLNFAELLNSKSAGQLTVPFVEPSVDTSCIKDGEPSDCTLRPGDIAPVYVNEFESTLMRWQAMDLLDALDGQPRPRVADGQPPLTHDGLPTTVPNIAVSNGLLNTGSANASGRYARINLQKKIIGIDQLYPDETINLHNSPDPNGSGLAQLCRLNELETSGSRYLIGSYKVQATIDRIPTFVPTASSLHLDNVWPATAAKELPYRWHDAIYQAGNESHFNFDDRQCQFLVYHLDGKMKGDRDGYPVCRSGSASCAAGAKRPGAVIAPDGVLLTNADDYCDPDDDDPRVFPGALPGGLKPLPDIPFDIVAQ